MALGTAPRQAIAADRDIRSALRRIKVSWASLRRDLRAAEPAQIIACAVLGVVVALSVDLLRRGVMMLHSLDFEIPVKSFLSAGIGVDRFRILIVPRGDRLGFPGLCFRRVQADQKCG